MIKFPTFNKLFLSESLFEGLTKEGKIEKINELNILCFRKTLSIEIRSEKFMPKNCGAFVQNGLIVAIYKDGKITIVPETLRKRIKE
jgi:hypothetical protein